MTHDRRPDTDLVALESSASVPNDAEAEIPKPVLTGGIILTVATFASIAANFLFQVLAGRVLGPSEYSLLGSLFTVISVITISASALQAACAKDVATGVIVRGGRPPHDVGDGARRLLRDDPLVRRTALICGVLAVAVVALSPLFASFLDSSVLDIVAMAFLVPAIGLIAIALGRLQGQERFIAYAVLGLGLGIAKLVFGVAAIAVGLGVTGGLMTLAVTSAVGAGVGLTLSRNVGPTPLSVIESDVFRAVFAIGLFTLMISIDVPIARHFFDSDAAGQFAAAAVIGHGVIWLPEVVAIVVFPEMVKARAAEMNEHRLLLKSAAAALTLCLAGVAVLVVAGPVLFDLFYGDKYSGAASLAWKVACRRRCRSRSPSMFLYDHLAGKRWRFIVSIAACVCSRRSDLFCSTAPRSSTSVWWGLLASCWSCSSFPGNVLRAAIMRARIATT